ncbi:hypothetical protein [Dysgonomonas sp. Marseille-P4361]|uniref:hypothetical protein n=1 Tax=Dysgonomonas sp. Marseille-P4361 TaxID=2161820 RepID=UPI001359F832|nr:hypothetical protein [Dysgonomonas sp. Marseille-P4361]
MRLKMVLLIITVTFVNIVCAQHRETPFLLDVFEEGVLIYKDGGKSEGLFNYNTVNEKLVFVARDSTVMEVANPSAILILKINERIFEHIKNGSFYERVPVDNNVYLYIRWHSDMFSEGKVGAYGMKNPSSSIDSKTSIYTPSGFTGLSVNESYVVKPNNFYYIKIKGKLKNVTKKSSLTKLFKGHEVEIEDFIKAEKLDWDNIEGVKKTIAFCSKFIRE